MEDVVVRTYLRLLAVSLILLASCNDGADKGVMEGQVDEVVSDTQVMKEAVSAANRITRNATDCDAVRSNIEEVNRKLDEVEARLQTAAGRTSMQALRTQVKRVADACGAS
jgi:hypothetical protein